MIELLKCYNCKRGSKSRGSKSLEAFSQKNRISHVVTAFAWNNFGTMAEQIVRHTGLSYSQTPRSTMGGTRPLSHRTHPEFAARGLSAGAEQTLQTLREYATRRGVHIEHNLQDLGASPDNTMQKTQFFSAITDAFHRMAIPSAHLHEIAGKYGVGPPDHTGRGGLSKVAWKSFVDDFNARSVSLPVAELRSDVYAHHRLLRHS